MARSLAAKADRYLGTHRPRDPSTSIDRCHRPWFYRQTGTSASRSAIQLEHAPDKAARRYCQRPTNIPICTDRHGTDRPGPTRRPSEPIRHRHPAIEAPWSSHSSSHLARRTALVEGQRSHQGPYRSRVRRFNSPTTSPGHRAEPVGRAEGRPRNMGVEGIQSIEVPWHLGGLVRMTAPRPGFLDGLGTQGPRPSSRLHTHPPSADEPPRPVGTQVARTHRPGPSTEAGTSPGCPGHPGPAMAKLAWWLGRSAGRRAWSVVGHDSMIIQAYEPPWNRPGWPASAPSSPGSTSCPGPPATKDAQPPGSPADRPAVAIGPGPGQGGAHGTIPISPSLAADPLPRRPARGSSSERPVAEVIPGPGQGGTTPKKIGRVAR